MIEIVCWAKQSQLLDTHHMICAFKATCSFGSVSCLLEPPHYTSTGARLSQSHRTDSKKCAQLPLFQIGYMLCGTKRRRTCTKVVEHAAATGHETQSV